LLPWVWTFLRSARFAHRQGNMTTMQSMTGYGKAEAVGEGYSVTVEIKSVNNRFLEFQARTSRSLLHLEPRLKQELSKHVARGSVTCHVQYDVAGVAGEGPALNEPVFRAYLSALKEAQTRLGPGCVIDVAGLLRVPEIMGNATVTEAPEISSERVLPVFEKACRELVAMRAQEGRVLAADMESRIRGFFPALAKVKTLVPQRQEEYVVRMRARVKELIGDVAPAEDRLVTEIGIMAERLDVTEEIVRLEAHLNNFLETMASHKTPGKRLGFLLQEMLREVNTLGTKSQYADMQHQAVAWKEDLEIIREQIQNIE
jgi:uncharacterized protein (TIGR00255 family)